MTESLKLSTVKPDFEDISAQLQQVLSTKETWKDLITTATGQTIIEFISAVGAFSQYNIESTFQEAFTDTAKLDSSIYAITRMLGVRMTRKLPAHTSVLLTRTSGIGSFYEISAFSQFSTNAAQLFNRQAISFAPGEASIEVTLYEGTAKEFIGTGIGLPFQSFLTPETNFSVSDVDVTVFVDGDPIPVVPEGLWHHGYNDPAAQDTTNPSGQLDLFFGNNAFGTMPANGSEIRINYIITKGANANNVNFIDTPIAYDINTDITGRAITGLVDGANEHAAELYRKISPLLFAAGERAVTQNDYEAIAFNYPGVLDVRVLGQRDLAPTNVKWMNLIRMSIIASSPWDDIAWKNFIAWYRKRTMYSTVFYRYDPIQSIIDINAKVFCFSTVDLNTVRNSIIQALQDFFSPRKGIIGLNVYKSDVLEVIKHAHAGVDYIKLYSPFTDTFMSITGPVHASAVLSPGGTLIPDTYLYHITSLTNKGETLPVSSTSITLTTTGSVTITWTNVEGAIGFRVYGRKKEHMGLLLSTPQTNDDTYTFSDVGSLIPGALQPDVDTSGIYYPVLGNVSIETQYTDRNLVALPS